MNGGEEKSRDFRGRPVPHHPRERDLSPPSRRLEVVGDPFLVLTDIKVQRAGGFFAQAVVAATNAAFGRREAVQIQ